MGKYKMLNKIPTTVVTGFLGAGKTTLIRHLINNAGGRKIALIINEFGDLGVDGEILKGCNDEACSEEDIVELSNGCICCTVADDFIPTMKKLLERDTQLDHILIETSGLALPQPLVRAFKWPEIRTKVTVDGVITVVDGKAVTEGRFAHSIEAVDRQRKLDENLNHETPLSELFEDQIACADMIVINKSDLLTSSQGDNLLSQLKQDSRDGVQVLKSEMGVLPVDVLLGQKAVAEDDLERRHELHHHHHDHHHDQGHDDDHDHDDFESFIISMGEIENPEDFSKIVLDTIRDHDILRLKGFIAVKGKPFRLTIQAVGPRIETYFDRVFKSAENRETKLVVIGEKGMKQGSIKKALKI
jgi:cobalamin biosynthesis protein CobW